MWNKKLEGYRIILGSGSPRRKVYLEELMIPFVQQPIDVEETYPNELRGKQIPEYLAKLKCDAYTSDLKPMDILLTSDTIVWHNEQALGKPESLEDAKTMLTSLSNTSHKVITSICLYNGKKMKIESSTTDVHFKRLTHSEIEYYVNKFKPLDKAGAYGIQEWIGKIGITKIVGSYENVVGLPTQLFYEMLNQFVSE